MSRFNRHILSAALTVLTACSSSSDASTPASTGDGGPAEAGLNDPKVVAELRDLSLQVSSNSGVPSPKTMVAVAGSDHQAATMIVSGAIIPDHAPVYVIEMTGGIFTPTKGGPAGAAPPQSKFLIIVVDAATLRVTDISYINEGPNLDEIGSVQVDLLAH